LVGLFATLFVGKWIADRQHLTNINDVSAKHLAANIDVSTACGNPGY
jgi:hypothetical protein